MCMCTKQPLLSSFVFYLGLKLEELLEGGGKAVALEEGNPVGKLVLVGRQCREINREGGVHAVLSTHEVGAVDALEHILGTVLLELSEALERDAA